jgi:hypothetical protein
MRSDQTSFATSASIAAGVVVEAQRFTTLPCLSMRNFSKFHYRRSREHTESILRRTERTLMRVMPNRPDFSFFNHLYTSLVLSPFTSLFFISGKLTPNSAISIGYFDGVDV